MDCIQRQTDDGERAARMVNISAAALNIAQTRSLVNADKNPKLWEELQTGLLATMKLYNLEIANHV